MVTYLPSANQCANCWRRKEERLRDVLLWITSNEQKNTQGRLRKMYIGHLNEDSVCRPDVIPNCREWQEWMGAACHGMPCSLDLMMMVFGTGSTLISAVCVYIPRYYCSYQDIFYYAVSQK